MPFPPKAKTINPHTHFSEPTRRFIGWQKPIIPAVIDRLLAEYSDGPVWDMRHLLVVLPSGQARRRLQELLAVRAEDTGKILYPPRIVTVGALPEQLYVAKYPFASELVQHLAWVQALRATPKNELDYVVPAAPPSSASGQWLELGKILASVHRELASDRLDFERVAEALGQHPEAPRWNALAKIQERYFATLDQLQLWDIQTARLRALDFEESEATGKILLIGCVDLNATQRGFVQAIAENVEIWIAAPQSAGDTFDPFGCLLGSAWQDVELDIPSDALLVGNTPADQAELTTACVAQLGSRYHTRELTIGVPDGSLVSELKHQLALSSVKARFGPGTPLAQSEPVLLLSLIGQYLDGGSYHKFAALLRHPAIENLLRTFRADVPDDWLSKVDAYYRDVLPKNVDGFVNEDAAGAKVFSAVTATIRRWLKKLRLHPQPVSSWVQPLLAALSSAYGQQTCDLDDPIAGPLYLAAKATCEAIIALRDIPSDLEPTMTVSELVDWLIRNMSGQLVPEPHDESAVEMLGWLDLALDDAPALIITGMHDGVVPESVNSDAFLPNQLRRQLGMLDNVRRYARDMYSLQVMLHSRETLRLVVGKTDSSGDPLVPSRLLMACPLAQLPSRVLHLVQEDGVDVLPPVLSRWHNHRRASQLPIPHPQDYEPPKQISVTAFRDYLQCPYRYYLRHVLKLREEEDAGAELDAPQFGVLLHDTLAMLGKDSIGQSTDADDVKNFLVENLHELARSRFGPHPPAAVLIQIEQAESRLEAFSIKQAERAAQGWQIRIVEEGIDFRHRVLIGNDEAQLHLIARIDRVDYHPESAQWAVWDYKTSETAKNPLAVHWSKQKGWLDLQLPLYRAVARELGVEGTPTLGYIAIPKQAASTGFHVANFTPEQLRDADDTAADVASRIVAGEFEPRKAGRVPYDSFERICQSSVQHVVAAPPARRLANRGERSLPQVPDDVADQAAERLKFPKESKPPFDPLLIRASAGTGKTFQLSNRLLQILLSGQEVDSILAMTFTRKAAGEIMHRVLQRLALGCLDCDGRAELETHLTGVDTSAVACLAALRRVTRTLHRLRIGTLDSFFAQIARTFSLEMALPPGWRPLDPVHEPQFQMQAVGQMLDKHDRRTLVSLVRMLAKGESQRQVGEQIRQTVSSGFGPYRCTTEEAWDQLPLPKPPSESAIESALIVVENTRLGHKSADSQLAKLHLDASIGNWEAVISHGIYSKLKSDPPSYYGREFPSDLVIALESLAERAAAELLPIRRNQTLASYQVLAAYDSEYESLIRLSRSLAFSDVTHYLSQWILSPDASGSASPGSASPGPASSFQRRLALRLDCGVHHLLLDEFQDTAPDQWRILRPLATPLGGDPRPDRSFFCVGDTKQAIYGWRGGVAEIFDSVDSSIAGLKQQQLRDSFRSSPQVIRVVNQVFSNLTDHANYAGCEMVAAEWSRTFPAHRTSRESLSGYVRLQNGPKVARDLSSDERKQAFLEFSADQIAELTRECSASVGVLLRTNADVGRMIGLLRDRGVSASQDGGNPLTDSAAVELILSLVHLADHPGDGVCAFHVATSPLRAALPVGSRWAPTKVANWFRRQVFLRGLGNAIEEVANMLADKLSWWDQHRLEQLIRSAFEFQSSFSGRLSDFEETVTRQRVALQSEAQVKVMTIHKSKGLEFDAVFLPDLEIDMAANSSLLVLRGEDPCQPPNGVLRYMNASLQAMLPKSWQEAFDLHKQRGVTESLCLLYVAITRARVALVMTARPTSGKPAQDFQSLLQSTLGVPELKNNPETVLYEDGDKLWYRAYQVSGPVGESAVELEEEPSETETLSVSLRTDRQSAPVRGLRVAAPSSIGRTYDPVALSSAFSYSQSVGATYGTLIHAFFEQIHWLEDFQGDHDSLRKIALATVEPEALRHLSLDRVIGDFEEMLELSSVRAALSRSRYLQPTFGAVPDSVEIDNERVVSVVSEGRLITGTIDRLAILIKEGQPYAAEIIDFKTDAFDPSMTLLWLEERIEHHRPQLEVYSQVVSKLFQLPHRQIATYLVMLSTDDLAHCSHVIPPEPNLRKTETSIRQSPLTPLD